MRQIIFFVFILLIFPSICIGEMAPKEQRDQNQVTYEEAISLSGLDYSLSNMKLVTHFPDMRDMLELGRSPEEVCENLAKKGIKCWFKGPVPFIETGFTLGEFCHSIFNQKRRCLFKPPFRKTFDENAAKAHHEWVLKNRYKSVAHKKVTTMQKKLDRQVMPMLLK